MIGPTAEGRQQYMAIITSPQNHLDIDHYKEISRRLALAEGLTDEEARLLAQEGKAVVWIDGGLHASEVCGSHQLLEMVCQMASLNDPEKLCFLNDAIPAGKVNMAPRSRSRRRGEPDPEAILDRYRGWLGKITLDKTVPKLVEFLEKGSTVLVIGSYTNLGPLAGVPMTNHLVNGEGEPFATKEYYIPSSILQMRVDNNHPLAYGMKERIDVFFNNSPVFRLLPEADKKGVTPVA